MITTLNLELGETEQLPLVNCLRGRRVGSNFSCVSESRVFVAAALKVGSGLFLAPRLVLAKAPARSLVVKPR